MKDNMSNQSVVLSTVDASADVSKWVPVKSGVTAVFGIQAQYDWQEKYGAEITGRYFFDGDKIYFQKESDAVFYSLTQR